MYLKLSQIFRSFMAKRDVINDFTDEKLKDKLGHVGQIEKAQFQSSTLKITKQTHESQ